MDCIIGDDLVCRSCGRPARAKGFRRACGPKPRPTDLTEEHLAIVSGERVQRVTQGGPGTELKKLLAKFGIVAMPGCSCNAMAARMDAAGPDGSEAMIDEVLDVMKQEAGKRGLPWVEMAARMLVKRAIRNARARK